MAIKVNKPTKQEAIVFNKLHLSKCTISQPLNASGKKNVTLKTHLYGYTESGTWMYNKQSKWEASFSDFDAYAIELYMKQNECSVVEAQAAYKKAVENANNADILEVMAYFQKGIALLYNESTQVDGEVEI